jgi:hypothetical protein
MIHLVPTFSRLSEHAEDVDWSVVVGLYHVPSCIGLRHPLH